MPKTLDCLTLCSDCAEACLRCVNDLVADEVGHRVSVLQATGECAEISSSTARVLAMEGVHSAMMCAVNAEVCDWCANECARHDDDLCRACAEACRKCAEACRSEFD